MRLLVVCLLVFSLTSLAQPRPLRVLLIGNSHLASNELPALLASLAQAEPRRLEPESVLLGGHSLEQHWHAGQALTAIRRGGWDLVVLQAQSLEPIERTASHQRFVRAFDDEVRRVGARSALHLVWARWDIGNPLVLQPRWTQVTLQLARERDLGVVPVGIAWQQSLTDHPEVVLHQADGNHPTLAGSYLMACTYYAALYHKSPEALPIPNWVRQNLGTQANHLQRSAWQAMAWLEPALWP